MCNHVNHTFKCNHIYTQLFPCATGRCPPKVHQIQSPSPCAACAPAYAKWAQVQQGDARSRMLREQEEERLLGEKYRGLFEVSNEPQMMLTGR